MNMHHPLPTMRLKSRWFRSGEGKSAGEHASAMAFIVFRVAQNMLKRMRGAQFDIDAGPAYFAFLREVLAFLVAYTDRLAHGGLAADARHEFTVALVHHLSRTLAENERDLLGPEAEAAEPYEHRFIDLVNEAMLHYADFGAVNDADATPWTFEPDFGFVRTLGHRLEPTLPEKDRHWVVDQVMAIEAPEATTLVQRAMRELVSPSPRRARRAALQGE